MLTARLSQIEHVCNGQLHGDDVLIRGMAIDTRRLRPGNLFLALPGARSDGHLHLAAARQAGAAAAMVSRRVDDALPQILVDDVQRAAGELAAWHHRRLGVRTLAITGSNGKTTVKNLCRAILSGIGPTLATSGNYNNELGLPLTLAELGQEHLYAVLEMGAGKPGDIAYLCRIARPDVSVVTQIGVAHLEMFGSRERIAETKGAIYAGLAENGIAIINRDDEFAPLLQQLAGQRRCIGFGASPAEVHLRALQPGFPQCFVLCTPAGEIDVSLPLLGAHNLSNALAAAAACLALGATLPQIAAGLAAVQPERRRLELCERPGLRLLDDSYNANPDSLRAALAAAAALPGPRWLLLGDMGELGPQGRAMHADCGHAARAAGFERLYGCGALAQAAVEAFGAGGRGHASREALLAQLQADLAASAGPEPLLLVKGSRAAGMDRVVDALMDTRMDATEVPCCSG